jgi:tripartite-type tricarboxylate transporter receptor subunit TctC
MDRRTFVAGSAAAAAAFAFKPALGQEPYPARPVTLVNPFPPGGAVDVVARPLASVLEPILKQPLVIETKAGAAGQVGRCSAPYRPDEL